MDLGRTEPEARLELHGTEPESKLAPKPEHPTTDVLSAPRAEVISRVWQAVAYLEEARADLGKQVRKSTSRELAADVIKEAVTSLVRATLLLTPAALTDSVPHEVRTGRRKKDGEAAD
ncbi:MAG TPA: hypothetical protein VGQ06_02230 [Gemmatimonadales bacterium]|jgi:SRSO17 transposase|nr:hypothetical protein [Gemmatimonadales bacterium]